jgi:hypothetical protein
MQGEKYQSNPNQQDELEIVGYTQLIGAIFRLTSQDLKFGNEENSGSAKIFVDSTWFTSICEGFCLNPMQVKGMIIETGVKSRKNYE